MNGAGPSRTRILFWLILGIVALLAATVYLVEIGERGVAIASVIAGTATIAAIFVPMAARRWREASPDTIDPARLLRVIVANLAIVGLIVVGWWAWRYLTDVEADLGEPFELSEGAKHVVIAGSADQSWRGTLVFTPYLENESKLGDCVGDAVLKVTPSVDKVTGTTVDARHGVPAEVGGLEGGREVTLEFRYEEPKGPKQDCRVKVVLRDATLRR